MSHTKMGEINIDVLCRICVKESHFHCNIYKDRLDADPIYDIIKDVCGLYISTDDGLPRFLCVDCLSKLREFKSFKIDAQNGSLTLRLMKEEMESITIKQEDDLETSSVEVGNESQAKNDTEEDSSSVIFEGYQPGYGQDENKMLVNFGPIQIKDEIIQFSKDRESQNPDHNKCIEAEPATSAPQNPEHNKCIEADPATSAPQNPDHNKWIEAEPTTSAPQNPDHNNFIEAEPATSAPQECSVPAIPPENWQNKQIRRTINSKEHNIPGDNFQCSICDRKFIRKFALKTHLLTHSDERPHKCELCGKCFKLKNYLKLHLKTHNGDKRYKCIFCAKMFVQKGALSKHLKVPLNTTKQCKGNAENDFLNECRGEARVMHMGGKKLYECLLCNRKFNTILLAKTHLLWHKEEKPLQCEVCDKRFLWKSVLVAHMTVHSEEKPYQCHECNANFRLKSYLVNHLRIHTGEKPFKCKICKKDFRQSSDLAKHVITHTNIRRHKCDICSKAFKSKVVLGTHSIIHGGIKRFGCYVCEKRFYRKGCLTRHLKCHHNDHLYGCNACKCKFLKKHELAKHVRKCWRKENPMA